MTLLEQNILRDYANMAAKASEAEHQRRAVNRLIAAAAVIALAAVCGFFWRM